MTISPSDALIQAYTRAVSSGDFDRLSELVHKDASFDGTVANTAVGSVLCSEFLSIEDGLISASTLIFDWRRWPEVIGELRTRASAGAR